MTGARAVPWLVRTLGWGLVYLILAGAIGLELDWGRHIRPLLPVPKPAPAARTDYPIQPEFILLPVERGFAETTARPVFTPTRLPPPPLAPPAPPKPAMQKGQFVLLGALITKDNSIALLRDVLTNKATRVEQGKTINGVTVANVYPEKVILTQYDDSEELVLKIQPGSNQAAMPKIAPRQPGPPGQLGQPGQTAQQPGQVVPQVPAVTPASGVPEATAGGNPQSLINRRRAARGLPPI